MLSAWEKEFELQIGPEDWGQTTPISKKPETPVVPSADPLGMASEARGLELLFKAMFRTKERFNTARVRRPPGSRLLVFADFCFSAKTRDLVLEPCIVDLRKEHNQALSQGRRWKAKAVLVRGYASFCAAVAAQLPLSALKMVLALWKVV